MAKDKLFDDIPKVDDVLAEAGDAAAGGATGAAATPPAAKTTDPPAPRAVLEHYKSQGLDVDGYESDFDFASELAKRARVAPEVEEAAQRWHQLQNDPEYKQWSESRQVKKEELEVDDFPLADWKRPEIDPSWEQLCEIDEATGRYVLKESLRGRADSSIADRLNEVHQWKAKAANRLIEEYPELTRRVAEYVIKKEYGDLDKRIADQVASIIESRESSRRAQDEWQSFLNGNKEHLYELDENGAPKMRGDDPILTEEGQKVSRLIEEASRVAKQYFNTDYPSTAYITEYVSARWSAPQSDSKAKKTPAANTGAATPPENPIEKSERLKEEFEKEDRRLRNGESTSQNRRVADAVSKAARDLDAREMLLEEARARGLNVD